MDDAREYDMRPLIAEVKKKQDKWQAEKKAELRDLVNAEEEALRAYERSELYLLIGRVEKEEAERKHQEWRAARKARAAVQIKVEQIELSYGPLIEEKKAVGAEAPLSPWRAAYDAWRRIMRSERTWDHLCAQEQCAWIEAMRAVKRIDFPPAMR